MNLVWRSWFWNIVLMLCLLLMGMAGLGSAYSEYEAGRTPGVAGFAVVAAVFVVGAIRALMLGVSARPSGIVQRGLTRTTTIPWNEIEDIKPPAHESGAGAPMVVRRVPGESSRSIELSVLGGYGLSPSRPTPGERAAADLKRYLSEWRKENSNR